MSAKRWQAEISLGWAEACGFRLQQMVLVGSRPRSLPRVANRLGGVQAQVHSAAELQFAARTDGIAPGAVDRALYRTKTLVKTWMMRGTIHYLDPDDLPVWASASATRRTWNKPYWQKAFGITAAAVEAALEIIPEALDGAPLTREELADAVHHITRNPALDELMRAGWGSILKIVAAEGKLCFGPNRGRNVTFTRPDAWLKRWREPPPTDEAIKEVCRRYLASHGPATREEFARWWGFTPPDATKVLTALEHEVVRVEREGDKAYALRRDLSALQAAEEDDDVRLLPMFDAYTLAALPHDALVPRPHKDKVYRKGAWVSQAVTKGGRIVGVWTHERKPDGTSVDVKLFRKKAVSKGEVKKALEPYLRFVEPLAGVSVT